MNTKLTKRTPAGGAGSQGALTPEVMPPDPDIDRFHLHIVELFVENVKHIKAARVKPKGDIVLIAGRNSQGKSSLMDALSYALGGKALVPAMPIRKGQKSGKVVVDLDKYRVERRFTEKGSQLYVTGKEGEIFRSPQELLDRLVGDLTFDPSEFVRMKDVDQLRTLQGLVGVNLTDLNQERDIKFARRTEVNRQVKALEVAVRDLPHYPDAPMKEIELGDLGTRLQEATGHNEALEASRRQLAETELAMQRIDLSLTTLAEAHVFLLSAELKTAGTMGETAGCQLYVRRVGTGDYERPAYAATEVEKQLAAGQTQRQELEDLKAKQTAALEEYVGEHGDTTDTNALVAEYSEAGELNKQIRANIVYQDKAGQLTAKKAEADTLTKRLDEIEREKRDRLASAKFPVPGLSFTDDGVTFNDSPFNQASSSDQIRVSFGMALELNKNKPLKLCLIREGSLLDEENFAIIEQMAIDAHCQLWIEKVGGDGQATVIIEDGEVQQQEAA